MTANKLFLAPAVMLMVLCLCGSPLYAAGADFNNDGIYDVTDIDALVAAIAAGTTDLAYDLNIDDLVDKSDIAEWLNIGGQANVGAPYLAADSNLDGTVDGQDFDAWKEHSFTSPDSWSGGDFNADGIADGYDFLIWNDFKNQSVIDDVTAVPEPGACCLILCSLLALHRPRR